MLLQVWPMKSLTFLLHRSTRYRCFPPKPLFPCGWNPVCVSVSITSPRRCEFSWLWWVVVQWAPVSASAKAAPIIADTPELTFGMQLPKEPSAHRAAVAGDVCCGRFHPISNTTLLVQKKLPCPKHSFLAGIFEPIWCRTQSQACMDRICSYLFYQSNAQPTLSWWPHCKKTNIIQQPKAYQMHDALSSAIQ